MTTILASKKFILTYTNKNGFIFKKATNLAYETIDEGQFGIIYDDYNPDIKKINQWKKDYKNITVFNVATRGKTLTIDSKIAFHNKMSKSTFTPESYLNKKLITDKESLYFVKKDGGTGAKGVHIYTYDELQNINTINCVIQKNMKFPDLHNNKRYKIRQLVFLHNKCCYIHRESWASISDVEYNSNSSLRDKHIIYQKQNTEFILSRNLNNFDKIYKNILKSIIEFTKYYHDEIQKIEKNEFVILGFDFVVDKDYNVQIIEINHRSNYGHPENVSNECDVAGIKDLLVLLIKKSLDGTKLIKI